MGTQCFQRILHIRKDDAAHLGTSVCFAFFLSITTHIQSQITQLCSNPMRHTVDHIIVDFGPLALTQKLAGTKKFSSKKTRLQRRHTETRSQYGMLAFLRLGLRDDRVAQRGGKLKRHSCVGTFAHFRA